MSQESLFPKEPPLGMPGFERRISYTNSAREAWGLFLNQYASNRDGVVLLPAYIGHTAREGSGIFDPVRASGVAYRFYGVDDHLRVSVDALAAQLSSGDIGALLLVHWFGFPAADISAIRDLCRSTGVLLIEDCAHVVSLPGAHAGELGAFGDVAFYSVHKVLGGVAGGALVWNTPAPDWTAGPLHETCDQAVLAAILRADFPAINLHRRALYRLYLETLSDQEGVRFLRPDLGAVTPQSMAMLIESGLREPLYFYLMEAGLPVTALYYELIGAVDEALFPEAFAISRSILNLPVHQGVTPEQAARLAETLREGLSQLSLP
ncbi:MAG: DegT/DnrJ/EryC1/StrS family aminotransferase [Pseudomonadota bacterium]